MLKLLALERRDCVLEMAAQKFLPENDLDYKVFAAMASKYHNLN